MLGGAPDARGEWNPLLSCFSNTLPKERRYLSDRGMGFQVVLICHIFKVKTAAMHK